MHRKKRRFAGEINLTPLLDVLFSILFIVMLTGTQSEKLIEKDVEEYKAQIEILENEIVEDGSELSREELLALIKQLKEENERLKEENEQLKAENEEMKKRLEEENNISESMDMYETDAVIVTMMNETDDGNHILKFFTGQELTPFREPIRLGTDKVNYIKNCVNNIISEIVGAAKDKPVFIVFHCNAAEIYRKEEFLPISEELAELTKIHKEVFYHIVEK